MSLDRGIAELAELLRRRAVSSVQLTREALERIDADRPLNAYATIPRDQALAAAGRADEELLAAHDRGPLHGLPVAIKDNIDTAGVRTTGGSRVFHDRVPGRDATVWARLRRGGAVLVGKTNLHEFAYRAPHPDFGPVHNPYRRGYSPGGSSSGSGAAVAAGHVVLALGTDTGGSVRQPAAFCGVVGMKPARSLLDREGVLPLARSLDAVGILTRDLEDARVVLEALAGARWRQGRRPETSARVGIARAPDDLPLAASVGQALEAASDRLARAGHRLSRHALPPLEPLRASHRLILIAEAFAEHRERLERAPEDYGPLLRDVLLDGSAISAADYLAAQWTRDVVAADDEALFGENDLLLLPAAGDVAPPLDPETGRAASSLDLMRWTFLANFADLPAISVPVGTFDGLPLGLQLVGRRGSEAMLLAIAAHVFARVAPAREARCTRSA